MYQYSHPNKRTDIVNKRINLVNRQLDNLKNKGLKLSSSELSLLMKFINVYVLCGMPTVYPDWLVNRENIEKYEGIVHKYRTKERISLPSVNYDMYKLYNILCKFYTFNTYIIKCKIVQLEDKLSKCFGKRIKSNIVNYIEKGKNLLTFYQKYAQIYAQLEANERYKTITTIKSADDDHIYAYLVALSRSESNEKTFDNSINKIKKAFKKYCKYDEIDIFANYYIDVDNIYLQNKSYILHMVE